MHKGPTALAGFVRPLSPVRAGGGSGRASPRRRDSRDSGATPVRTPARSPRPQSAREGQRAGAAASGSVQRGPGSPADPAQRRPASAQVPGGAARSVAASGKGIAWEVPITGAPSQPTPGKRGVAPAAAAGKARATERDVAAVTEGGELASPTLEQLAGANAAADAAAEAAPVSPQPSVVAQQRDVASAGGTRLRATTYQQQQQQLSPPTRPASSTPAPVTAVSSFAPSPNQGGYVQGMYRAAASLPPAEPQSAAASPSALASAAALGREEVGSAQKPLQPPAVSATPLDLARSPRERKPDAAAASHVAIAHEIAATRMEAAAAPHLALVAVPNAPGPAPPLPGAPAAAAPAAAAPAAAVAAARSAVTPEKELGAAAAKPAPEEAVAASMPPATATPKPVAVAASTPLAAAASGSGQQAESARTLTGCPQWLSSALLGDGGTPQSLLRAGYLSAEGLPDLSISPIGVLPDSRNMPMRAVVWDPAAYARPGGACGVAALGASRGARKTFAFGAAAGAGTSAGGDNPYTVLAVGSNAKALTMVRVPGAGSASWSAAGPQSPAAVPLPAGVGGGDSSLRPLSTLHKWRELHLGSVYAAAWACDSGAAPATTSADADAPDAAGAGSPRHGLLATCSNDTTVRVVRWMYDAADPGRGSQAPQVQAVINTDAGTLRDVAWLGAPLSSSHWGRGEGEASGSGLSLATAGGGDFGVRLYDCSAGLSLTAQARAIAAAAESSASPPVVLSASAGAASTPGGGASLLLKWMGHQDVVHSLRPWGADGRTLVSCSADGSVRLWDVRSAAPAQTLYLSSPGALTSGSGGGASSGVPSLLRPGSALPSSLSAQPSGSAGLKPLELHSLAVRACSAGRGGAGASGPCELAVGCADGSVAVIDVVAGRMLATHRVHTGEVRSVDAAGPLLLTASFDGAVAVSALASTSSSATGAGEPLSALRRGADSVALAVLLARSDHRDKVLCARWHPTQPLIASSSADKTALIWQVRAGSPLAGDGRPGFA
jgi:WD40 repeat protein